MIPIALGEGRGRTKAAAYQAGRPASSHTVPGDIRPHDLRHACASLLLEAGESVKVVAERLGHSTATITLDVYAHVLPGMQEQATQRLQEPYGPPSLRSPRELSHRGLSDFRNPLVRPSRVMPTKHRPPTRVCTGEGNLSIQLS